MPDTRRLNTAPPSIILVFFLLGAGFASGQPPRLATEARLDLKLAGGGTLTDGALLPAEDPQKDILSPGGACERMNWLPAGEQAASYMVTFPVTHYAESECIVRVQPSQPGEMTLSLMGQWAEQRPGVLFREEVRWTALDVDGAQVTGEPFAPVTTWHNDRQAITLKVTDAPVTVSVRARSVVPPGMPLMQPITARDTPAHQAAQQFQRGVNLGNYLEAPPGQDWGARFTRQDLVHIHGEGFDHVRIPVAWHHYAGPGPDFTLQPGILARVDELVKWARENDLSVMINMHHFDPFTSDPQGQKDKFLSLWRQIAEHYRDADDRVAFEILNEPKDAATTEVMSDMYAAVLPVIRESNPRRTGFVGPGSWNSPHELARLRLPEDDTNLIVTVHSYDPFLFTHQGASWTMPLTIVKGIGFPGPPARPIDLSVWKGLEAETITWIDQYNTLPTAQNPSSPQAIDRLLQAVGRWQETYGRPVHLGEFGAVLDADPEARARFYRAYRESLDRYDLGWAIWEWKAAFRYWNPNADRPMTGMREALRPHEARQVP